MKHKIVPQIIGRSRDEQVGNVENFTVDAGDAESMTGDHPVSNTVSNKL